MPWCILNEGEGDAIVLQIAGDGAAKRTVEIGGGKFRAFDGSLRATVTTEKFEWELRTAPLDEEDATAIEALLANGNVVTLSGDIVGVNEFDIMGTVLDSALVPHKLVHKRQMRLLLQQV
jgi:hypothetical protein